MKNSVRFWRDQAFSTSAIYPQAWITCGVMMKATVKVKTDAIGGLARRGDDGGIWHRSVLRIAKPAAPAMIRYKGKQTRIKGAKGGVTQTRIRPAPLLALKRLYPAGTPVSDASVEIRNIIFDMTNNRKPPYHFNESRAVPRN